MLNIKSTHVTALRNPDTEQVSTAPDFSHPYYNESALQKNNLESHMKDNDHNLTSSGELRPNNTFADSGEATNSAIRYAVTVGHRVSAPAIIALRDISYVMDCVKTGFVEGTDIRALIHTIRHLPNEQLARAMKAGLPWFCGSVCERFRSNATVKYANFAIFDLDHVPDYETVKKKAFNLPWVRWAFRSVRDGVKLIAQFDRPVTREEDYRVLWKSLAETVKWSLRLDVDATPDWSRACFFSFDPGLLYNSAFKAVEVDFALREASLVMEMCGAGKREKEEKEGAPSGNQVSTLVLPEGRSPIRYPIFKGQTYQEVLDDNGNTKDEKTGSRINLRFSGKTEDCVNDFSRARSTIENLATKRIEYLDWIKIGMAIYAGFGEGGRELWDIFLDNPNYEETMKDLDHHWRSFRNVRTITLATLFYLGEKYGA
jgi:hypothetical protein